MSTKNIALDSEIYRRLAAFKRESESFSHAVARMLDAVDAAHTGKDVLARLAGIPDISQEEADELLKAVEETRRQQTWEPGDLG